MKLMTAEIAGALPRLGSTEGQDKNALVAVKFFSPVGAATWLAVEGEKDDDRFLFFGWVNLYGVPSEWEAGYFTLEELEEIRLPLGLRIERDLYLSACTVGEYIEGSS